MSEQGAFFSPVTGAFVHSYKRLRLYIYEHRQFPYQSLNPLVKSLLYEDARFLEGRYLFEVCERADEADFFVFPCDLNYFENREECVYDYLNHFQPYAERHLFFDHRDQTEPFPPQGSIRLKVSIHREQVSDTLICIPYMEMVDNLFWYLLRPRTVKYDLSFIGERTDFRARVVNEVGQLVPSSYFRLRDSFYHKGYLQYNLCNEPAGPAADAETKRAQREEFINITLQSRFVLALRGYGLNSFRFYESLSLGVPPILVSDDCALPFESLVDYDKICFQINAGGLPLAQLIKKRVEETDAERYAEMCRLGRLYYDSCLSMKNFLFLLYDHLRRLI